MLQTFVRFMKDDRGAAVPAAVLPLVAGVGLGLLAAGGLAHHHLALSMPGGLGGNLDPGAAGVGSVMPVVAGATIAGATKWEWECGGKMLLMNRDLARDRLLFAPPRDDNSNKNNNSKLIIREVETPINLHYGEAVNQRGLQWEWSGDDRTFLIPFDLAEMAGLFGLTRDVVAYVTRCYIMEQRRTNEDEVRFKLRELAGALGLRWEGKTTSEALRNALTLGRVLTIKNMSVRRIVRRPINSKRTKFKNEVVEEKITFGFFDSWGRTVKIGGKPVPENQQDHFVVLGRWYKHMLDYFPVAPVPARAIEAANAAPPRIRTAVKNLAYYLAARVPAPESKVRLLLPTLQEICHIECYRWPSEIRKSLEKVMKVLYPVVIRDFSLNKEGYDILLAGRIKNNKNLIGKY